MPSWFDKWMGKSALSRIERLIADKLEEISRAKKIQFDHSSSIQKRIDDVNTEIVSLKKKRQRIEAEAGASLELFKTRMEQMEAELRELRANQTSLNQPGTLVVPVGTTMQIHTSEEQ